MLFDANESLLRSLTRFKGMRNMVPAITIGVAGSCKKVKKGVWGMPRLLEATKDVVSCEKLRGFANET